MVKTRDQSDSSYHVPEASNTSKSTRVESNIVNESNSGTSVANAGEHVGRTAIVQGESKLNQQNLSADNIDKGATIALGDGNIQNTINNYFLPQSLPASSDLNDQSSLYRGRIETPRGSAANVDVIVLWNNASWQFGTLRYDDRALTRFLESPAYSDELSNGDAILCVGLASHWVDKEQKSPIPHLPRSKITEIEEKTDERAFKLCQRLARHAADRDVSPKFFGAGLGYHINSDHTEMGEKRQRAIVIIRVNAVDGVPLLRTELRGLFENVLQHQEIATFEGWNYSRVTENRPICLFQISIDYFKANRDNCT